MPINCFLGPGHLRECLLVNDSLLFTEIICVCSYLPHTAITVELNENDD